ncbi:MAG: glycine--tRNA ligase subunit beta [Pseudomonadota bacterium]
MTKETLLIEVGTEELPPTAAKNLSDNFSESVTLQLAELGFSFGDVKSFVTPRRIAVSISQTSSSQPDQDIQRKGPAVKAAYDDQGNATKAALGFAKSCGVELQDLQTLDTDNGAWLYYQSKEKGKSLAELLPGIINHALNTLPIPRPMRWGDSDVEFVRPIHWDVVMHGCQVIACKIKNIESSNSTYGHRFHAPEPAVLQHADEYPDVLKNAKVIANFRERKATINSLLIYAAEQHQGTLDFSDSLLDEVTNLVEWPMAVVGAFDKEFLEIPQEVLVATMQDAQRYFPLFSEQDKKLIPKFIVMANIESFHPETVKHGNERVIRPRFEDAEFFWNRDRQRSLASRSKELQGILFEKQLGSLEDKIQRLKILVAYLCESAGLQSEYAIRAASLCKNDLLTSMVNEFPKLQGTMGRYYALNDNEPNEVAAAIEEHYFPKQSGDRLPDSDAGRILAICDRIDTLVGIFSTGKKPTGVKDPYALRRAALGVVRIAIECQLDFDLLGLLKKSAELLQNRVDAMAVTQEVFDYIIDRMRGYFHDQGIPADTFEAVRSMQPTHLVDFADRLHAVQHFRTLPESGSLAAANKRIRNILKKAPREDQQIKNNLFNNDAESSLYEMLLKQEQKVTPLLNQRDYTAALSELAELKPFIDEFFDQVMVMDDNDEIRNNRIALLIKVNKLFSAVADISLLQS